jgi:hypothetical protein
MAQYARGLFHAENHMKQIVTSFRYSRDHFGFLWSIEACRLSVQLIVDYVMRRFCMEAPKLKQRLASLGRNVTRGFLPILTKLLDTVEKGGSHAQVLEFIAREKKR